MDKAENQGKMVYLFEEGRANMRSLLGGKGAGLAEMTRIGLPVPPGMTITTEVCRQYYKVGNRFSRRSGRSDSRRSRCSGTENREKIWRRQKIRCCCQSVPEQFFLCPE